MPYRLTAKQMDQATLAATVAGLTIERDLPPQRTEGRPRSGPTRTDGSTNSARHRLQASLIPCGSVVSRCREPAGGVHRRDRPSVLRSSGGNCLVGA